MYCNANCEVVGIPDWGFFLIVSLASVALTLMLLSFKTHSYWVTAIATALSGVTVVVCAPAWFIFELMYGVFPDFYVLSAHHFWTIVPVVVSGICLLLTSKRVVRMSSERETDRERDRVSFIRHSERMPYSNYSPKRSEVRNWVKEGRPT